jgi:ubiquilin
LQSCYFTPLITLTNDKPLELRHPFQPYTAMSEEAAQIQINVKGPSELKLQITISTDKTVLDLKQAIAEKSDVEADRQRLIYSGRVLKDEDLLSVYKIQSTHTIHMVKGTARSAESTSQAAQPLPTMQTGQNPLDPLTQLNSHQGYGAMASLNPFADMGLNQNDPNMLQTMMNSPQFLQQMTSLMSNPAILDQIIASNPQLAAMGPQVREVFQSERFRELMSNPEQLQSMFQLSSMLQGGNSPFGGAGMFGGMGGGAGAFPAPGVPNSAATGTRNTTQATDTNPSSAGTGTRGPGGPGGLPDVDPAFLQSLLGGGLGGAGGFGGLGGGFGGLGSPTTPAAPADSRPPEERFEQQLQQLQEMGFVNAQQNIRALMATGGNVHSAIEYILGGGGL